MLEWLGMPPWLVALIATLSVLYFGFNVWYVVTKIVPRVLSGPPLPSPAVTRLLIIGALFLAGAVHAAAIGGWLAANLLRRILPSLFPPRPQGVP